jgi:hypothetical protein
VEEHSQVVTAGDERNDEEDENADDTDTTAEASTAKTASAGVVAPVFDVTTDVSGLPFHGECSVFPRLLPF